MADYIPQEIIVKILQRLNVKTLLRCTSVCKSWYSLIISPQFISTHSNFAAATNKNSPLLLIRRYISKIERYALCLDNKSFIWAAALDFPFRSMNSYFTIIGSCNGLLCLSDDRVYYTHQIILWNPCIKKSVVLPKPNLIYNSYGTFVQSLGFGFDPVSDDYKVVRITYVDYIQVELYRLSTGVWQDISHVGLELYVICNPCRQAYVRCSSHWIAHSGDCCYLVLLFDMCCDVFREMRLPADLADSDPVRVTMDLMVYMDSLCLIVSNLSGNQPCLCLWIMKEYGVVESWSKHLMVDFQSLGRQVIRPLWIRRCGEVITVSQDGRLVCYDPRGAEVEDLDLGGDGSRSEDYRRAVHVDSYAESLVLLDRGQEFSDAVDHNRPTTLIDNRCDGVGIYGSDYERYAENDHRLCQGTCANC